MFKDLTNSIYMIHDKMYEKHKLINKLGITSTHYEIYMNKHINRNSLTKYLYLEYMS